MITPIAFIGSGAKLQSEADPTSEADLAFDANPGSENESQGLREEQEQGERIERPLNELPPGPWRSLGRCLDYTNWTDRNRFLALDREIEHYTGMESLREQVSILRRCRARLADGRTCSTRFPVSGDYEGWKCEEHRSVKSLSRNGGGLFNGYSAIRRCRG